jgi:hypothetical protein
MESAAARDRVPGELMRPTGDGTGICCGKSHVAGALLAGQNDGEIAFEGSAD